MPKFDDSPFVLAPQQERSRVALEKIVRAAATVIAAKGMDGFSMADVAAEAGIPVASIYRRFRGKGDLIQALKLDATSRIEEAIDTRVIARSFPDIDALVSAYAQVTAQAFEKDAAVHRFLFSQPVDEAQLKAIGRAGRLRIFDLYRTALMPLLVGVSARRSEVLAVVSFQIIAAALLAKARGDNESLNAMSWKAAAKEFGGAAVAYLKADIGSA